MKDRKRSWIKRNTSFLLAICLSLVLINQKSIAQSGIPILSWRTHFSYNQVKNITSGDNKVFAATDNAIFFSDLEDNSINLINKNSGLSGVGIGTITYDSDLDQLIIGYQNGNIDFWSNGSVTTIRTIAEVQTTSGKQLRDIRKFDSKLYLSGDLGVVVYDLGREEITEAYQNLGPNGEALIVYQTVFANDSIYAATESGILSASLNQNVNRQDFNNWKRALVGIEFQHITHSGGSIFASADSEIFEYASGDWSFDQNFPSPITSLNLVAASSLYVLTENALWLNDVNGLTELYTASNGQVLYDIDLLNNQVSLGSSNQGLLRFNSFTTPPVSLQPPGPASDVILKPAMFNENIYWIDQENPSAISKFDLEVQTWGSFNPRDTDGNPINTITDIDFGIINENDLQAPIFSSFDQGLFSGGDDLNGSSNITQSITNGNPPTSVGNSFNISSIASQGEELLWLTVTDRPSSLYSLNTSTNSWTNYSLTSAMARFPRDLFIGPSGNKWMSIEAARGGGIVVYDEANNRQRNLNTNGGQGGLPGNEVTSMAADQNGFLWVGTNQGIAFFPNPSIVLENRFLTANVPIFENRLLLRDEFITQVVIDPANRKWFGTQNNGLWLFSETGEELVYHFTTDNSPLPSDNVLSLVIDPPSGEIFIGTDKGTVSFRSDATQGTEQHINVEIYPNPVNPSFQGNIVINGLANNALVKITDVSGKLVRQVRANGSTTLWNARDITGKRVNAGVYLVFSSNLDGSETFVGKIVVI